MVKVELQKSGVKRILMKEPLGDSKIIEKAFHIAIVHPREQTYSIIIDDDIIGWTIGKFHVEHNHVDKSLVGKRFYDVNDDMIIKIVKK